MFLRQIYAIINKMEQEAKKYICENCEKEAGQIIWNAEKRIWECVRCYYTKKEG